MTRAIVTTPVDLDLTIGYFRRKQDKLEDFPFYQALHSVGKHLFIEYDETNANYLTKLIDLDLLGVWPITLEEFERHLIYHAYSKGGKL